MNDRERLELTTYISHDADSAEIWHRRKEAAMQTCDKEAFDIAAKWEAFYTAILLENRALLLKITR